MSSHRLVPGDVVVLQQGRALWDVVLLRGACLVTESMLSGEVQASSSQCQILNQRLTTPCMQTSMTLGMAANSVTCHPSGKYIRFDRHFLELVTVLKLGERF